jgi:hypothetical protein
MANAYSPGGGYTDGMVAQEENMYTVCLCVSVYVCMCMCVFVYMRMSVCVCEHLTSLRIAQPPHRFLNAKFLRLA